MDTLDQPFPDLREGRLDAERLIEQLNLLVATLRLQLQTAQQRIAALEQQLGTPAPKLEQPFSLKAEEQRQQARGKKKKPKKRNRQRRGRVTTAAKLAHCTRREPVYPQDVAPQACWLSHVRPVWRLEHGQAVLVAYEIYRGPNNQYGKIPDVLGRSEFGLEIVIEIAYLVYETGLSFDKVCEVLEFFQDLAIRKSQVNALLRQLSRHWEREFEILCTLLANSLVVHADETSWSLHSVWAFISEKVRIVLYGVHKDGATLGRLLDPETFAGIVISDDASVYANFSVAQKCWAHLLRKAIKLTLQEPNHQEYRVFTDQLVALYGRACAVQQDQRFSAAGRAAKVKELEDELFVLCGSQCFADLPRETGSANTYRLLVQELMRLLVAKELFTFVTAPPVTQPNGETKPVSGTNNEAERTLRGAATARKIGRTNKTLVGARCQTILTSVLESLRLYLPTYTLASVVQEIYGWWAAGQSCFAALLAQLNLKTSEDGVLDQILPQPSG